MSQHQFFYDDQDQLEDGLPTSFDDDDDVDDDDAKD
jgi:hypothetical protein